MRVIGITGSSGSGKTTVCEIIKKLYNSEVLDADKVAKELSSDINSNYYKEMVKLFGEECVLENKLLNRRMIAEIIYQDDIKRKSLNDLTFNYVVEKIKKDLSEIKDKELVIIDAPLLYEAGVDKICDKVIAIIADKNNKVRRICLRDGIDEVFAKKRLLIQNEDDFYIKKADYIIYNNKDIKELEESIKKVLEEK